MTDRQLRVEMVPVSGLVPYARNSRTHSPEQVSAIAASIREFGFTNPVLVDPEGGIVAGHGRVLAAIELGMGDVPVLRLGWLTAAQRRAYVIADNKLAERAGWDATLLGEELRDLQADGFDLGLLGFDAVEAAELIAALDTSGGNGRPDEAPPVAAVAVSRLGDVWVMGSHRLLCGDSTRAESVASLMGGAKAALLWTDPPYGVSYVGKTKNALQIENDGAKGLPALLAATWASIATALQPGSPYYIAHPAGALSHTFTGSILDAGWAIHETLVWVKDSMVLGHSDYHYKHEPILYGWVPGPGRSGRGKHAGSRWFGSNSETSVFEIPRPKASPDHPTGKPVALVERHIANSSQAGDIVLEPFSGSGTTIIAAEMTGRSCHAIELSPQYVDVAVRRWQNFTGGGAILESSGQSFAEVEAARAAGAAPK